MVEILQKKIILVTSHFKAFLLAVKVYLTKLQTKINKFKLYYELRTSASFLIPRYYILQWRRKYNLGN